MPLDDRIRDSLRRDAAAIHPDVEHHLERVARGSRPASRPARSLVALAASIVGLVVLVQLAGIAPMATGPTGRPTATESPTGHPLAGTYRVILDSSEADIGALDMGGAWTITLGADAAVGIVPPASFRTRIGRSAYAVVGDLLHTSALARDLGPQCAGSGTYRWELRRDGLHFTLRDDTCRARVVLFTSAPWVATVG
jgi:hypothetical protein